MSKSTGKLLLFPVILLVLLIFTACGSGQQAKVTDTDSLVPTTENADAGASPPVFDLVEVTNGFDVHCTTPHVTGPNTIASLSNY